MTNDPTRRDPLDDWFPLEQDEHDRQLAATLALLALLRDRESGAPVRVTDLGAGSGRIAKPLGQAGHDVLAIDSDPGALALCAAEGVRTCEADFLDLEADLAHPGGPIDAALCLGHTFMLLVDPASAVALLRRLRAQMKPGAPLAIDAFPRPLWADVADGAWATGVSEDGQWQLIWAPTGDNVLALRHGEGVDPDDYSIRPTDTLLRLWSMGELALLAAATGFAPPREDPSGSLVLLEESP